MKRQRFTWMVFSLWLPLLSLFFGCSPRPSSSPSPASSTNSPPPRSAVVDVITQRGTVEAGLKARDRIREIDAAEQKKMKAVLESEDSPEP